MKKEISEVSSIPTDEDDSKYLFDSSDEEENISSEQRKLNKTNSVASRMKNAMLSKILAKLIKTNPHINPEDIDMDVQDLNEIDISELQLYDDFSVFNVLYNEVVIRPVDCRQNSSLKLLSRYAYLHSPPSSEIIRLYRDRLGGTRITLV